MSTLSMNISGMTCGHCVRSVQKALEGLEGVQVEEVKLGSAVVRFDEGKVSKSAITEAVEDEGYAVTSAS